MAKISKIYAREILDSRGKPTIEVEVWAQSYHGVVQIPSGASLGLHEAVELRDNDRNRFFGKGVFKAISSVHNEIKKIVLGMEVTDQEKIDRSLIDLDGTRNKSRLGSNAILGVSLAVAKAAAHSLNIPLYKYLSQNKKLIMPTPMINIINGGAHANNNLDIQEFMIIPKKTKCFIDMIRMSAEVFHTLKDLLSKDGYSTSVGDEGGFAPSFDNNKVALDYIMMAIQKAGYLGDFSIAIDAASSTFYHSGKYLLDAKEMDYRELTEYYCDLLSEYPITSIEDGMGEEDVDGWKYLTKKLGSIIQLVGDDVFVTNPDILKKGIANNIANAILIKPNQIGTLTETLRTMQIAEENKYNSIISHRSGETEDTTIAHIAVATSCGQIKTGSLSRSERIAKYNELIRIEENLND